MRLPNGTGGVTKLSGKRRNPYRVRKTKGWTDNGKQIYVTIGYYPTRKEALEALISFNLNPYDIETQSITFAEVYEKWFEEYQVGKDPSGLRSYKSAFNHSKPLHNMRMRDIKVSHLDGVIANADIGQSIKCRMKSLYNMMYRYCLKHEIVDKDYAALMNKVEQPTAKIQRKIFTDDEIRYLFSHLDAEYTDMLLIGIFSGWRPQELATLRICDIDLDKMTMHGGMKTASGKDRIVPIHTIIQPLIQARIDSASKLDTEYIFANKDHLKLNYDVYRHIFDKLKAIHNLDHTPHDTRHTFITLAKKYDVDEYVLKRIVGHSVKDITEHYTHRDIKQFHNEIKKIRVEL